MIHDFFIENENAQKMHIFAHSYEYYMKISTCNYIFNQKKGVLGWGWVVFQLGTMLYINRIVNGENEKGQKDPKSNALFKLPSDDLNLQMNFFILYF